MNRQEQIQETRKTVASQLGFSDFDGTPAAYKALTPKKQVQLTEAVAQYIKANAGEFPSDTVAVADKIVKGQAFGSPLEDISFGANVAEFGKELGNEAGELAKKAGSGFAFSVGVAVAAALAVAFLKVNGPKFLKK